MHLLTRRDLLAAIGAVSAGAGTGSAASSPHQELAPVRATDASLSPPCVFFSPAEARFIQAACGRLIPTDAEGPGAVELGVPRYMDRQLAGPWGSGAEPDSSEPWQCRTLIAMRLPHPPAQTYRRALSAIHEREQRGRELGESFDCRPPRAQDAYLRMLAAGSLDLGGVPSAPFFQMLLRLTVEGFFRAGGSRAMLGWSLPGFAGAIALKHGAPRQAG